MRSIPFVRPRSCSQKTVRDCSQVSSRHREAVIVTDEEQNSEGTSAAADLSAKRSVWPADPSDLETPFRPAVLTRTGAYRYSLMGYNGAYNEEILANYEGLMQVERDLMQRIEAGFWRPLTESLPVTAGSTLHKDVTAIYFTQEPEVPAAAKPPPRKPTGNQRGSSSGSKPANDGGGDSSGTKKKTRLPTGDQRGSSSGSKRANDGGEGASSGTQKRTRLPTGNQKGSLSGSKRANDGGEGASSATNKKPATSSLSGSQNRAKDGAKRKQVTPPVRPVFRNNSTNQPISSGQGLSSRGFFPSGRKRSPALDPCLIKMRNGIAVPIPWKPPERQGRPAKVSSRMAPMSSWKLYCELTEALL